jgi:hypothetical protein
LGGKAGEVSLPEAWGVWRAGGTRSGDWRVIVIQAEGAQTPERPPVSQEGGTNQQREEGFSGVGTQRQCQHAERSQKERKLYSVPSLYQS